MKTRDVLVAAAVFSALEAVALNAFAPHLRPAGGVGRLLERFFVANIILFFLYSILIRPYFVSPLRHIPGPKGGSLIFGHALQARRSKPPGDQFRRWMEEIPNDGLIRFRDSFGNDSVFPTSHATLKAVVTDNTYDYEKQENIVGTLRTILGDGLILVEGKEHKFQRKHLLPSFQVSVIRDLYPTFWAKACELTHMMKEETTKPETEFGVWCTRVTLDIIGIAGFGRDFNSLKNPDDEFVRDYQEVLEPHPQKAGWFLISILVSPAVALRIPFWEVPKKLKRISKSLYDFAYNMSKERRAELNGCKLPVDEKDKRNDILSLLVKSNDFSDNDLAHQVLTMMAAGHETTSNTLGWCAYLLATHPEIQTQLRDEIRTHLPSPDNVATETITAATVDSMPLLNAVCNETLRLYPVVPITSREVVKETMLGPYKLPVGTNVFIAPWAVNRNTGIWGKDAMEFIPQRWIDADGRVNNSGGVTSNYSIMTFLHGPRSCIGQGFARSELKCLVAALVGRYDIKLTRERDSYYPAGLVTTKAANGMWLKFGEVPGW
ncbi:cytochrome P450 [Hortaea werneckii]|nr:cytochrome P450 [Hortaea werneckii]